MDKVAFSIKEAAEALGISRPKMYDLIYREDFPAFHVGTRVLIPVDGLRQWAADQVANEKEGTVKC